MASSSRTTQDKAADARVRDLVESPEDVVTRALAILEDESRAWTELSRNRQRADPRGKTPSSR